MKRKRTLIISLLLVAALALGIGYAGFTSQLSIGGEAVLGGVSESQVVITSIELESVSGSITQSDVTVTDNCGDAGTKNATVDVSGFKEVDDTVTLLVTVSNPHAFEVTMSDPLLSYPDTTNIISGSDTYFDFEIVDPTSIPDTIEAHNEVTFKVSIKANIITPDAHTSNFNIGFAASTRPAATTENNG